MSSSNDVLYRLCLASEVPDDAWKTRLQWMTCFTGVKADDKFMHLSTAEQVVEQVESYFAGKDDVMLLSFSSEVMREEADLKIKWEEAAPTGGAEPSTGAFPHVYGGPIPWACLTSPPALLALGADGKHVLPMLGPAVAAGLAGPSALEEDHYVSSDDDYDGCGATGMYG